MDYLEFIARVPLGNIFWPPTPGPNIFRKFFQEGRGPDDFRLIGYHGQLPVALPGVQLVFDIS